MLLGGQVFPKTKDPEEMADLLVQKGFQCSALPYGFRPSMTQELAAFRKAFESRNLVIAEVGAWSNPHHPDSGKAAYSMQFMIDSLAVAEEVGARCCVNIIGSLATGNNHPGNFSKDFYDSCVEIARKVIDAVNPKRAKMCFEIEPFNFLDSPDSYIQFLYDVDRKALGIHLDPFNMIHSPRQYYDSANEFRKAIQKLAPYGIVSMHLKDLKQEYNTPNTQIRETMVGKGEMDIRALFEAMNKYLPADTPLLIEHLKTEEEYDEAVANARRIAASAGLSFGR